MFDNIGVKIKKLATIIFGVSLIVGGLWFCFSLYNYIEYYDFLEFADLGDDASRYTFIALAAKSSMIYSIALTISGIILSFLIAGFGQIIIHLKNIDDKLNGTENKKPFKTAEELSAEMEKQNDPSYIG